MTLKRMMNFKPCPFCGTEAPQDLIDNLYPSGIFYNKEPDGYISYYSFMERQIDHLPMYKYICNGCDVEMNGHTEEEVLEKWNNRVK